MRTTCIITTLLLLLYFPQFLVAEDNNIERFQIIDNTYIVDSDTDLMWAIKDNGKDIDWWEAKKYCEDFSAGGYSDWRLPDIKELATLYSDGKKKGDVYKIAGQIKITDCCIWSSYDVLGGALSFSFKSGKRIPSSFEETYQLRSLPVRGTSKIDLRKYRNF
jgi:hypothetical protein